MAVKALPSRIAITTSPSVQHEDRSLDECQTYSPDFQGNKDTYTTAKLPYPGEHAGNERLVAL
jgi:hypothetical protein